MRCGLQFKVTDEMYLDEFQAHFDAAIIGMVRYFENEGIALDIRDIKVRAQDGRIKLMVMTECAKFTDINNSVGQLQAFDIEEKE
ncbi:MAG: hypothetical protein ACXABY_34070 [Candidatus Thorarchaeota archaeon]|jgi:hypothetical protein